MPNYKAENNADLQFTFPKEVTWDELDKQGVRLPVNMKFVDLVIERETDVLLVEVKDPSNIAAPEQEQQRYYKRLVDNSVLTDELTPKARDSYTYLHLMEKDNKDFLYIVLLGLDAFDEEKQKALLLNFKDRLASNIHCECEEPWKRKHISDCVVCSVEGWNQKFPDWPVVRLSKIQEEEAE